MRIALSILLIMISHVCSGQKDTVIYFNSVWRSVEQTQDYTYYRRLSVDKAGRAVGNITTYYRKTATPQWTGQFLSKNLSCRFCDECVCDSICSWYNEQGRKTRESLYSKGQFIKYIGIENLTNDTTRANSQWKTRLEKFTEYNSIKNLYRSTIKNLLLNGIDINDLDYASSQSRSEKETFLKIKSYLRYQANELGLKQWIADGLYDATVKYDNANTNTLSTYQLKVQVEKNVVTAIHFTNGGSVHAGSNSSEYRYFGGELDFDNDVRGNVTRAVTLIRVATKSSTLIYTVTIE